MEKVKDLEIKGKRITIRPLKVDDVYLMRKWGFHENPLLEDYNFPKLNDRDIKIWYRIKTNRFINKYFSIRNESDELIGYMGIKNIKKFTRETTLGLVLDPNQVDKGYGTEILETFLAYYFTGMRMRRMILEVAEFNKRAFRLYEKIQYF